MLKKRIIDTYIEDCKKTESLPNIIGLTEDQIRLFHVALGMQTETAEFSDALKKHIFYGKELDKVNLKEELGDILWYISLALDVLDSDFETEMARNISKLKLRYPDKFSSYKAEFRDLDAERKLLEGSTGNE